MRENEIHIRKGEEGKVEEEIGQRKIAEPKKEKGWRERERFLYISDLLG